MRGLEALMYRKPAPPARYAQPDHALIPQELKRKGVTLQLRWEEYEKAQARARTVTASSACTNTSTAPGSPDRCARSTAPGRRCSSTTAATPSR